MFGVSLDSTPRKEAEEARDLLAGEMGRRVVPALRFLERFVRPRWAAPAGATERVVGGVVLLLAPACSPPCP
ncbi:MAG: hypothetical protein AVDCRST_MAG08-1034 [uncultured Acetobacteraceae bacterium]|uniref:Uncharacterized protein n=1 Tax=uncultured Acetobacteraceae bacterium TaxID=169975 RepID=A0A6J4HNK0_9PROT|nr:MAG: hypothetical protein AVDCRST_MAG08-1034 [uncultured Acetobacteraceae bacterium]